MNVPRIALYFAALKLTLELADSALADQDIVGGKAINSFAVPFSGTVTIPTEDVAIVPTTPQACPSYRPSLPP